MCAIGTVVREKEINFNLFKNRTTDLWRPYRGMRIEELDDRLILFRFYHPLDLRWVLDNGSWTYESCLVSMNEIQAGQTPDQVSLEKAEFWIQVNGLLEKFCTLAVGRVVGEYVRGFVALDENHRYTRDEPFMRIHAKINVLKPLKKQKKIRKSGGEWLYANYKYEKIPTFCFTCGRMGHVDRLCGLRFMLATRSFHSDGVQGCELQQGDRSRPMCQSI
ncbi:hypothetical protein LINGRAHAP2_LOCUS4555 [Linum grandiflorum]